MVGIKFLSAVALASQRVFASPTPATPAEGSPALAKRGEGIHMFNCWPWGGAGVPQTWLSIVVYCANDSDCSNIQYGIPGNNVCVKKTTSQSEAYHTWEGSEQSCTFPTGVTFKWNIPANAQLRPNYSFVSTGTNGYKVFDGFKDDHGAAPGYNYHSCEKIYYYI